MRMQLVSLCVLSAFAAFASAGDILTDNFNDLSQWTDLSKVVTWGSHSTATSAFTTSGGAATLTADARANSGYSATNSLKTFTALDYQFDTPIQHRDNIVTIDYRVRWEGLDTGSGEGGRFIVTLNYDYPAGGLDTDLNDKYDNVDQTWWARPTYEARIRNGTQQSWLQYGGGKTSLGEYEQYHSGSNNWWLGGFISGAGGVSPGSGADYPANSWVSSPNGIAKTSFQTFRYVITPDAQMLYVDKENGQGFVELMSMPLPETNIDGAPLYQYFDQFEGVRLYWRGASSGSNNYQALLDSINVNVTPIPEPASMSLLALGALAALRRRRNRA